MHLLIQLVREIVHLPGKQNNKVRESAETSGCDNHVTTYNLHVYLSIPPLLRSLLTVGFFYIC